MEYYFDNYKKKNCNGCSVCALKCPKKAIEMKEDSEGFIYPQINKNKCINCNLCKKVCPNHKQEKNNDIKAYIAINKNEMELKNSASGGMFIAIAKQVIENDGVVYGVKYDENLKAVHDYTEDIEGLKKFQGSKYVKSDMKDSYTEILEFLKKNRIVMFSGTPCQCNALKAFVGKKYENLITCEIICHANPSPLVFELYKKNIELKYNKKIRNISFRSKKNGWKNSTPIITFEDESEIEENSFYKGFVNELFNRPSCHNCNFCSTNRLSDFTIGDMWGIEEINSKYKENNTGISLLTVNSKQGDAILEKIKEQIVLEEVDVNLAFSYNHNSNIVHHIYRKKFFDKISNKKIDETNLINYMEKYCNNLYIKIINKIWKLSNRILK